MFRGYKYLIVLFCLLSLQFQQPSNFDTNAKIKAVFIYNFTRYFEWPEGKKEGNFIIYIVGRNEHLISELKALAGKKKVGNQDIEVKSTPDFDNKVSAQIIYFLSETSRSVSDAASKNKGKGTLILSENPGATKTGSSINFVAVESKLKFEYSKNNAVKAGLKTNDDFKALSINVD